MRPFSSHATSDNKTNRNSLVPVNQQMPYFIVEWGFQGFFKNLYQKKTKELHSPMTATCTTWKT